MDFEAVPRTDLATYDAYLSSLSTPIESYVEEHILTSDFRRISVDGDEVGFFAIHDGSLLTQFHVVRPARRLGHQMLDRILIEHRPAAAYVVTGDNFLLSHLVDRDHVLKRQAYFFAEGVPGPVGGDTHIAYRRATEGDAAAIRAVSGDFLDRLADRIADGQIHVGWDGAELAAVGIAEPGRLLRGHASIGMFTNEAYRQRGIGTMTIQYLRNVCHAEGVTPIAGCAYHNANSKRTLEAAGMVTTGRLLRIEFQGLS